MPAMPPARSAGKPVQGVASAIARSLDRATYEGYRLGFEAARDEAALMAELAGQGAVAAQLRAMRPLPDKNTTQ